MNKHSTEETMQAAADGNAALECGIEELRIKYELKAQAEAKQKEKEAAAQRTADALAGCAACEKERIDPTVDMTMEDADLEALRQSRMEALKSRAAAVKRHTEAGGGEYREITEEDFLKEVRRARQSASAAAGQRVAAPPYPIPPRPRPFRSLRTATSWCTFTTRSSFRVR